MIAEYISEYACLSHPKESYLKASEIQKVPVDGDLKPKGSMGVKNELGNDHSEAYRFCCWTKLTCV